MSSVVPRALCAFAVLSGFFFLSPAWAGDWQPPDADVSLAHFPVKLVDDLPHLFISDNIAPFAVGSVVTALDWATLDGQNNLAGDLRNWHADPLFNFGDFYGEGWVEGGAALASWGIGSLVDNLRVQEFGRDAAESLIGATVTVEVLKYAVGRERPDGSNNFSFPSGHTITAFCVGPAVTKYWGWGAGATAYALGTWTALARVEGYHHYLSDTIAGAALGIIIGNAVVYSPKDVSLSYSPSGLALTLKL